MKQLFIAVFLLSMVQPVYGSTTEKMNCPIRTNNEDENKKVARQLFLMGGAYYKTQDYQNAVNSYECVLTFVPYSLVSRYHLAKSYEALGLYSKARVQYQLVVASESEEAKALTPEIKKRLREINGLADKVNQTEEKEEMLGTSDSEATRQKDKISKLEKELAELKKQMEAVKPGKSQPTETEKVVEGIGQKEEELRKLQVGMTEHKELVKAANAMVLQKDPSATREAIAKYLKALELYQDYRLYYNIGTGFERLGDLESAKNYYSRFLANVDKIEEFDEERRALYKAKASRKIEKIDQLQMAVKTGSEEKVGLDFPVAPPITPKRKKQAAGEDGVTSHWWFWSGLVLTGALTASTVYLGLTALDLHNQLKDEWTSDKHDQTEDYKLYTDLSLGAAVLTGGILLTAILLHEPERPASRRAPDSAQTWILPSCSGNGCMLTMVFSF